MRSERRCKADGQHQISSLPVGPPGVATGCLYGEVDKAVAPEIRVALWRSQM